jgi:beta-N-acetylhexosaminidase
MSDDVSMKAPDGSIRERCEGLFAAGCDLALHCNGDGGEMAEVAEAAPLLAGEAAKRAAAALSWAAEPGDGGTEGNGCGPVDGARAELDALLAPVA